MSRGPRPAGGDDRPRRSSGDDRPRRTFEDRPSRARPGSYERPPRREEPEERPRGTRGLRPRDSQPEPKSAEVWIDEGPVRKAAGAAVARAQTPPVEPRAETKRRNRLPGGVVSELVDQVGKARSQKLADRLDTARRSFDRERYGEAKRIVSALLAEAPGAASVRELLGLCLYRMDRYKEAAAELETFVGLTHAVDQHPVLADCYRALKKYARVDELWTELKEVSPSAELVAEGRIVAAGSLADRGRLQDAVALLEKAPAARGKVKIHHLRQWYALADLYDRAGDPPRARRLFERVRTESPGFADVNDRLANLGR